MAAHTTEVDLSRAQWRKSRRSNQDGNCVEVAVLDSPEVGTSPKTGDKLVAVRDSKDPDGPKLIFTPEEWTAFTGGVKDGEFELG